MCTNKMGGMNKSWKCTDGILIQQIFKHFLYASHHEKKFFLNKSIALHYCVWHIIGPQKVSFEWGDEKIKYTCNL